MADKLLIVGKEARSREKFLNFKRRNSKHNRIDCQFLWIRRVEPYRKKLSLFKAIIEFAIRRLVGISRSCRISIFPRKRHRIDGVRSGKRRRSAESSEEKREKVGGRDRIGNESDWTNLAHTSEETKTTQMESRLNGITAAARQWQARRSPKGIIQAFSSNHLEGTIAIGDQLFRVIVRFRALAHAHLLFFDSGHNSFSQRSVERDGLKRLGQRGKRVLLFPRERW